MRSALIWLASLVLLMTMGCTLCDQPDSGENDKKGPVILKITTNLAYCVKEGPPPGLTGRELVANCLHRAESDELLNYFPDNVMRTRIWQGNVVLLVCDSKGLKAKWEDINCKEGFGVHHWKTKPAPDCVFTLDPAVICPPSQ